MVTEGYITSTVEEKLKEKEFDQCFLVDIEIKGDKKLAVFIDSEKGVSFGICKKLSRFLEERIEEENLMAPNYTLEVSSPGVERPLKFFKQYPKHLGRKMKVKTGDGLEIIGKLLSADPEKIVLEVVEEGKRDGKKYREIKNIEINFDSIDTALVLISF